MAVNYLVVDTECSGALRNKAHPFDPRNKLLMVGTKKHNQPTQTYDIEYSHNPFGNKLGEIQASIDSCDLLVGFNIKYDLHWLRRYGVNFDKVNIWDCQLAEFILSCQQESYPSLDTSCVKYALPLKKGTMQEYLDRGLDVTDIPLPELTEYLKGDLISTEELYKKQIKLIREGGYWPLFNVQCQDLLTLQDIEYNGMIYNLGKSEELTRKCNIRENELIADLTLLAESPCPINWSSNDHVSAVLYGGIVKEEVQECIGTFKTGARAGQPKYARKIVEHRLPRLVEPLKRTELAKDGYWSTAREVISELKATGRARRIVKAILELSDLEKIRGTYYEGIPKKFQYYNWQGGIMHGQINQCVARTGRTSSSNPNLQNQPVDAKQCFTTRY